MLPDCEIREGSAWIHGVPHCVPSHSVKDRYVHESWTGWKGQEPPSHAALEDGWKEKCHLQGPFLPA